MTAKCSLNPEQLAKQLEALRQHSHLTFAESCAKVGVPDMTMRNRIQKIVPQYAKLRPDLDWSLPTFSGRGESSAKASQGDLAAELREVRAKLASYDREYADVKFIKEKLFQLRNETVTPPDWIIRRPKSVKSPGIPCMMWSDFHWAEVIDPKQINGVNAYDLTIAHARARLLVERTISLLRQYMAHPVYDGVVVNLGGDMVSGLIHEEIVTSNAVPIMAAVVDLWGVLEWALNELADEFGKVAVFCVVGNHGRSTHKMPSKDVAHTSFDWLIYAHLQHVFRNDKRVTIIAPNGTDILYAVHNHKYLLTHGNQFRGGDGMIGHIGPVMRGQKKKLSRNAEIGQQFDTMIHGHFHTYSPGDRIIGNGCFVAGTRVVTREGPVNIEDVAVGDVVLSTDGTWQPVTNLIGRMSDDGLVHIKARGAPRIVSCTPNHQILAIKGESKRCDRIGAKYDALIGNGDAPQWVPADFLSPGDFVHIPTAKGDRTPISENLAWAYGLYVAEGCAILDAGSAKKHNRLCLTMHDRELSVLHRFEEIMQAAHGLQGRVWTRTKKAGGKTSEYSVYPNRDKVAEFRDLFGHLAKGKKLPAWMLDMTPALKHAVVTGWVDGDGNTCKRSGRVSATTISPTLAYQMFQMALGAGMKPALSILGNGGPRKSDSYTIHFNAGQECRVVDGEMFYRINARYRDRVVVPVYDLEVAGNHTYCVEGVGVHNSLCGYNEYAASGNFAFEAPRQAMWVTHPEHGITYHIPVYVDEPKPAETSTWVQWLQAA